MRPGLGGEWRGVRLRGIGFGSSRRRGVIAGGGITTGVAAGGAVGSFAACTPVPHSP